jgi:hypothetical protein
MTGWRILSPVIVYNNFEWPLLLLVVVVLVLVIPGGGGAAC